MLHVPDLREKAVADDALVARFEPLPDLAVLAQRWRALEAVAAPNFFTGWTWMGSWLRATGVRPSLLAVTDMAGADVALALFGRTVEKRKLGRVATLRLNEAGDAQADRAFIEYNAPLCRIGHEEGAAQAMGSALGARRDWRALHFSGVLPDTPLLDVVPVRRRVLLDRSPAHYVDLAAVRGAGGDYLSLLSANMRSQIRRSRKDYPGVPMVAPATDMATAATWLDHMRALNIGRHAHNAWDVPVFRAFVAEIVMAGLVDGSVQLLRVAAGEELLGYLLNFRCGGRAMNYQSAFAAPVSARAKPGLMAHAAAVAHHAAEGFDFYSLLAGKDRYKQSLATGAEILEWWSLERFSLAGEAEYWVRRVMGR